MSKPVIACVVGTRPDAIKTAPVVVELRRRADRVETLLISTGQHREMLTQALEAFDLTPDVDLAVMEHGQSLAKLSAKIFLGLDTVLQERQPAYVLAQGDTTTTFIASITAFYHRIRFGHVEAGLRTESIDNPFPEEFNRRATALVADLHFPPTPEADENLAREGIPKGQRLVTGNTGIDAVLHVAATSTQTWFPEHRGRVVLLTTHRRENWGEPQRAIAEAAKEIVSRFKDVLLVVPMHKNPDVRGTLNSILGSCVRVKLIEPPDYALFVKLMERSHLILTDSGGVQEEAPTFGKPVLVLRTTTERPEGVSAGAAQLVGVEQKDIVYAATRLLSDTEAYESMARVRNPYGDGKASERIADAVLARMGLQ